jgi:multiple sugar transport system substrate-binding protein
MKKKQIAAGFLAGAMALSLAACGGSGSTAASSAATDTTAADSTASSATADDAIKASGSSDALEVLIWDTNQQPGIQEILDEFTAKTGIKTDLQVKSWDSYWTLLEAAAQGGEMPDVMWMHSNVSQMYMKNGLLLKLDDYIKNSDTIDLNNYMSGVTDLYTYDGSTYAIPKDYDTIALWYNKTMFDAAGIAYPDETWTWDTLYDTAKKLTKSDGSQYGFAWNPSNNQDGYYNVVYSMGGKILSDDKKTSGYDDPNTLKAMDYVGKLVKDCCPSPTTMSETSPDVLLESGTIAMATEGSWMVSAFKQNDYMTQNCDVAVLPYDATTGTRASICNGLGWAASASTKRPDDCWKLLEWLGSKDMQVKQADLGVTMSAYLNTSDNWVKNTDKFNLQPYLDETKDSTGSAKNILVLRPYTYKTTVWEDAGGEALVPAWADPTQMESVCKAFAKTMNDDIAQENS